MRESLRHRHLLTSIMFLFEDWHLYPRGAVSPHRWRFICQDEDLKSFFEACKEIGDEAWSTEAYAIRQEEYRRMKEAGFKPAYGSISPGVINDRLENWRMCGRFYREAVS